MMKKLFFLMILVICFGVPGHAGENQDKRKAKRQEALQVQKEREQEFVHAKSRDLRAEDELYKEIQAQERLLSQLRKRLRHLHEDNVRKYGDEQGRSKERLDYIERYEEFDGTK